MNLSLAYNSTRSAELFGHPISMRDLGDSSHHLINNGPSPTSSTIESSATTTRTNTTISNNDMPTSASTNNSANGLNSIAYYHSDNSYSLAFPQTSQYQQLPNSPVSNRTTNSVDHNSTRSGSVEEFDIGPQLSEEELQDFIDNLDVLPLRKSEKRDLKTCEHPTSLFRLISEYRYDLMNVEEIRDLVQLRKYLYNNTNSVVDIPFHIFVKLWPLMDNILKSCHGSKHLKSSKMNMNNGLLYTQPFVCRCTTRNSTLRKHSNENGELQVDVDESDETRRGSVYSFNSTPTLSETVSFAKVESSRLSTEEAQQPTSKKRRVTKITIFTKPCHYKVNLALDFTNQRVTYKPSNDCSNHLHSVDYVDSLKKSSFVNTLIQEEAMRGYSAEELKKILEYYDTIFPAELNLSLVGVPHIRNKMIKVVASSTGSDYLQFPRPSVLNSPQTKHSSSPNITHTYTAPSSMQSYSPYYTPSSQSSRDISTSSHQLSLSEHQQQQQQHLQQQQQQDVQQQQLAQIQMSPQSLPPLKHVSQQYLQTNHVSLQPTYQQSTGHSPMFEKFTMQNSRSYNFTDSNLGFENIQFTH